MALGNTSPTNTGLTARNYAILRLSLLSAALSIAKPSAHAQLALDRFTPAPLAEDGFAIGRPEALPQSDIQGALTFDYAHSALAQPKAQEQPESSFREITLHFSAALGLPLNLTLFANLPAVMAMRPDQDVPTATLVPKADGRGLGDLSLGVRLQLIGTASTRHALAGELIARLPTARLVSRSQAYSGEWAGSYETAVIEELRWHRFSIRIRLGTRLRHREQIGTLRLGSELLSGLGARVQVDQTIFLNLEVHGSTFAPNFFERATSPLEALLGLKFVGPLWTFAAAVGPGLTHGFGTPEFRLVVTLSASSDRTGRRPQPASLVVNPRPPATVALAQPVAGPVVVAAPADAGPSTWRASAVTLVDGADIVAVATPYVPQNRSVVPATRAATTPAGSAEAVARPAPVTSAGAAPVARLPGKPTTAPKPPPAAAPAKPASPPPSPKPPLPTAALAKPAAPTKPTPPVDTDKDGLLSPADGCPDAPEDFDGYMDDDGCPDPQTPTARVTCTRIELGEPVYFHTDSAALQERSFPLLLDLASVLRGAAHLRLLQIEGHTDAVGSAASNESLARRRAESVVRFLNEHGVARERLIPAGFGERQPVSENETVYGRQRNRRVEVHVLDAGPPCGDAASDIRGFP